MKIVESTDNKFLGTEVTMLDGMIEFHDGTQMLVEKTISDSDGTTIYASSNYLIRVRE